MNVFWLAFITVAVTAVTGAFIWLARAIQSQNGVTKNKQDLIMQAEGDVERIFNDEFREELRNRGRLHFEKIINENAMFLKEDLQLTASQLNEYMQDSIKKVLKEEFAKYEESIEGAKQLAIESIEKTQRTLEEQRDLLSKQLHEEVAVEKKRVVGKFEDNMNQVINYYLLEAIGNEIDLNDQLEYVFRNLEDNKAELVKDIQSSS